MKQDKDPLVEELSGSGIQQTPWMAMLAILTYEIARRHRVDDAWAVISEVPTDKHGPTVWVD